eukprot:scaffold38315_cov29-Tisochrysis_lutea.AAC.1
MPPARSGTRAAKTARTTRERLPSSLLVRRPPPPAPSLPSVGSVVPPAALAPLHSFSLSASVDRWERPSALVTSEARRCSARE